MKQNQNNNRRLLAVDDDKLIHLLYRRYFPAPQQADAAPSSSMDALLSMEQNPAPPTPPDSGYLLELHTQGEDAVAAVAESLREERPFAAALIDMRMPPGIDGLETARRIRALDARINIIFVSAYSDHSLEEVTELISGSVRWFSKPIIQQELIRAVEQAFEQWARL